MSEELDAADNELIDAWEAIGKAQARLKLAVANRREINNQIEQGRREQHATTATQLYHRNHHMGYRS